MRWRFDRGQWLGWSSITGWVYYLGGGLFSWALGLFVDQTKRGGEWVWFYFGFKIKRVQMVK